MVGIGTAVLDIAAILVEVVVNAEIGGFDVGCIHVERLVAPGLELFLRERGAPNTEFVDLTAHVGCRSADCEAVESLDGVQSVLREDFLSVAVDDDVVVLHDNSVVVPFAGHNKIVVALDLTTALADNELSGCVGLDEEVGVIVADTAAEVGELRGVHPPLNGEVFVLFGEGRFAQHNARGSTVEAQTALRIGVDHNETAVAHVGAGADIVGSGERNVVDTGFGGLEFDVATRH